MFNVRVVSYSRPVDDEKLNDDLIQLVAYCARVSNPGNQHNNETDEKLIKYLIKLDPINPAPPVTKIIFFFILKILLPIKFFINVKCFGNYIISN